MIRRNILISSLIWWSSREIVTVTLPGSHRFVVTSRRVNRTSQEEGLASALPTAGQATLPDLFYFSARNSCCHQLSRETCRMQKRRVVCAAALLLVLPVLAAAQTQPIDIGRPDRGNG